MEARHLICITGWSVWHELQLLREHPVVDQRTLGQILIDKANEGVNVYIMIWDPSQVLGKAGMAPTDDEETFNFFKPTRVHCAKVPREIDFSKDQFLSDIGQKTWNNFNYSHHQKSVICDTAGTGSLRRLVGFIGGIDLTNGKQRIDMTLMFIQLI